MDHDNCPKSAFEHYRWKGRYIKYQLLLLLFGVVVVVIVVVPIYSYVLHYYGMENLSYADVWALRIA